MPNLHKHFTLTCQASFCCHDWADLHLTFMQNYVLVYLQNICDLAEYIKPQDPDPVTSLHPSDQVALIYRPAQRG